MNSYEGEYSLIKVDLAFALQIECILSRLVFIMVL